MRWISSGLVMLATAKSVTDVEIDENINRCIYISTINKVDIYCRLEIINRKLPHLTRSTFSATGRLLRYRTKVVITVDVVAPPLREGYRRAAGTEDGKGQNKKHRKTSAVKGTSDQVRIVLEDARAIVAEVELDVESGNNLAEDDASLGRVIRDISGVLDELGEVEIREREASNFGDKLRAVKVSRRQRQNTIAERQKVRCTHMYNYTVDGDSTSANCYSDRYN